MLQEMNNAEIWIIAVGEHAWDSWMVWGDLRYRVERDYQAAMKGRWPKPPPAYRVVARRK